MWLNGIKWILFLMITIVVNTTQAQSFKDLNSNENDKFKMLKAYYSFKFDKYLKIRSKINVSNSNSSSIHYINSLYATKEKDEEFLSHVNLLEGTDFILIPIDFEEFIPSLRDNLVLWNAI